MQEPLNIHEVLSAILGGNEAFFEFEKKIG